jgi:Spy/CpxP family protein refolding chaperone
MKTCRTLALLTLAAVLAFGAADAFAEDPPEQATSATSATEATTEGQTTPEDATAQPRARRTQVKNMWWHGPAIGSDLELTADQIDRMDQIYTEQRAARQEASTAGREDSESILEAAKAGDAETIDAILQRMGERRRMAAAADVETTRQVFRVLTENQLTILAEKYPVVIQRPWTLRLGKGSGTPRQPRTNRQRRAPQPDQAATNPKDS